MARPAAASQVPAPQGIFCPQCGGSLAGAAKFCPCCGKKVTPREPPATAAPLDPSLLREGIFGGMSPHDLEVVRRIFGEHPGRLGEIQVPPKFGTQAAEALEEAAADAEDSHGLVLGSGLPMQVLDRLTTALEGLRPASSTGDPLEKALDAVGGPSEASSSSGPILARRGAAARQAMMTALRQRPEYFTAHFQKALAELFPTDAEPGRSLRARDFLEHRSLLGDHRATGYSAWLLAGVIDAFARSPEEAKARAWLALLALEQHSIDRGNWMLAWELTFEPRMPPFAAFASRSRSFEAGELPASQLVDPRWLEVAQTHLREVDSFAETWARLTKAKTGPPPPPKASAKDERPPRPPKKEAAPKRGEP